MEELKNVINSLNNEQQQAVNTLDGPVMVVAGPGTGKTQLLSARVANILAKTDTSPQNILCLTFTNKAATTMRDRLTSLIGPEARHVQVRTFHSFAADIMNQYPDYFWNGAKLTTVPDSVQLDIIQETLSKLPLENPLAIKFAGQFSSVKPVKEGLKLVKEAGLTPDMLRALIEANLVYIDQIEPELVDILEATITKKRLPAIRAALEALTAQPVQRQIAFMQPLNEVLLSSFDEAAKADSAITSAKHVSSWKRQWLKSSNGKKGLLDERKRNQWWLELAQVYHSYREELHSRGYYDYADMLVEVISMLASNEELRADVQEQFLYVLIDEFQDTNPAQMRLAHLVADHESANGRPNLMVVGDDDQSIYKFNGAELNNLLNFRHDYSVEKPIVLTKNYRSTQAVLDSAKNVIEQAEDRLVTREPDITKNLVSACDIKPGEISLQNYKTREHQFSEVANMIAVRRENYEDETIAVLARNHDSLQAVAARLHDRGVTIDYERRRNILEHPAAATILSLLELLIAMQSAQQDVVNMKLSQILRHPMWNIPSDVLWQLAIKNRTRPNWLHSMKHPDIGLQAIATWLEDLAHQVTTMPAAIVIEHLLGLRETVNFTSPFRDYYLNEPDLNDQYLETLSAVQKLRHLGDEFGGSSGHIDDLYRLIQISRENNIVLNDESPFLSGRNAVSLLTIHKAKGMEFDTVFIIDAIEKNWQPRSGGRKPPANLPLKPYGDTEDDYIRLLYVALTRARQNIFVSSYMLDSVGEQVLTTPLLHGVMPVQEIEPVEESLLSILEESVQWPVLAHKTEIQLLQPLVQTYQLSVTGLINFLDVPNGGPQYFKERNILRLPSIKSTSLSYGTAVHAALEHAQILLNQNRFVLSDVVQTFEKSLFSEHLPEAEFKKHTAKGTAMLEQLFADYKYQLPAGSQPERSYSGVQIDGALIGGKLDRLDQTEAVITVVDYKTGGVLHSFTTRAKTQEIKAWKHKMQLIFYALLVRESAGYNGQPITGTMVYVETDNPAKLQLSYQPTEEDITELKTLLKAVYDHICRVDFPATDKYSPDIQGITQFIEDLKTGVI